MLYEVITSDLLYVGTRSGLVVIDSAKEVPINDFSRMQQTVQGLEVTAIYTDTRGDLWVGTGMGLFQQERETEKVFEYYHNPDDRNSIKHLAITSVIEDANHTVIIGTLGGLDFYEPEINGFAHLVPGNLENQGLNNPFVNSLLTDDDGNVWIGTDKGGVNHYNIFQKPFYAFVHDPANNNSISYNTVNSILKEGDVLWVGTAGGGLNRITGNGTRIERLNLSPMTATSFGDNFVSSIFRDSNNNLWIGTWGGGLKQLVSVRKQQVKTFSPIPRNNFV